MVDMMLGCDVMIGPLSRVGGMLQTHFTTLPILQLPRRARREVVAIQHGFVVSVQFHTHRCCVHERAHQVPRDLGQLLFFERRVCSTLLVNMADMALGCDVLTGPLRRVRGVLQTHFIPMRIGQCDCAGFALSSSTLELAYP